MTANSGDQAEHGLSRRRFMKTIAFSGGALAAATVGGITLVSAFDSATGEIRAYELTHGPDVNLWITSGEQFTIRVRRGTDVLEEHTGVTSDGITQLESDHFSAYHITAPTPA